MTQPSVSLAASAAAATAAGYDHSSYTAFLYRRPTVTSHTDKILRRRRRRRLFFSVFSALWLSTIARAGYCTDCCVQSNRFFIFPTAVSNGQSRLVHISWSVSTARQTAVRRATFMTVFPCSFTSSHKNASHCVRQSVPVSCRMSNPPAVYCCLQCLLGSNAFEHSPVGRVHANATGVSLHGGSINRCHFYFFTTTLANGGGGNSNNSFIVEFRYEL